jgi:hypothetical protein
MNNIYIRMNVTFEKMLKFFLYFYIVADSMFFYVFPYTVNDSVSLRTLLALITWAILIYFFIKKQSYGNKFKKYGFLYGYIFLTIVVMMIQYIYSAVQYSQTLLDVFMMGQCYFSLIMVPIYLYLFEDDPEECSRMIRWFAIIGIVNTAILLFGAVFLDAGISLPYPHLNVVGRRNNHIRVGYSNVGYFSLFYCFGELLRQGVRKTKLLTVYLILALIGVLIFVNTRVITIAVVVAILLMIASSSGNRNTKILLTAGAVLVLAYIIATGTVFTFFDSFSIDSEEASSTIARLNAIEYFRTYTDSNPLLGMGIIRPYTPELTLIWSGPYGTAYFDDLGLLGGFYRMGILGTIILVIPLLRMSYLTYRIWKQKSSEAFVFVGVIAFILVSQTAQNYLDFQRAVVASFYWAVLEFIYKKNLQDAESKRPKYKFPMEQQKI